jgi:excinuclease ABC subunit C
MGFDAREFLATLPSAPGVYRYYDVENALLYVGKARDLKKRVSSYFQKTHASPRTALMVEKIARGEITVTATEKEALLLENNLIKSFAPRYNVVFRDDKSYPYIMLTGHAQPQVRFYRGVHTKPNKYFGPFPSAWAVRDAISHVQRIFQLRTCDDTVFAHRSRPCLLHQIKRCSAPCVAAIAADVYARDVANAELFLAGKETEVIDGLTHAMEAHATALDFEAAAQVRDQIRALQRVLTRQFVETKHHRDVDVISAVIERGVACVNLVMIRAGRHLGDKSFFPANVADADTVSVLEAFIEQHYAEVTPPPRVIVGAELDEDATSDVLGESVKLVTKPTGEARTWLLMGEKNASIAIMQRLATEASQQKRERALQEALMAVLGELPTLNRIECFDISHTMGEATIASCVVYADGKMRSSEYRRYNVKGVTAGDDYGAMRYALETRYAKLAAGDAEAAPRPDLVLIDGGLGQLHAALEIVHELGLSDLLLIGVAKGEERKVGMEQLVFADGGMTRLASDNPGLHLVQQVRDEAHRFAITGHRAARAKARVTSSLEAIDGIGPKKRKALLAQFGGLQGVKAASVDDLMKVEGISRELAERVWNALR